VRFILILKQGWREIIRLIHPKGYFLLKLNQKHVTSRISDAVWGFVGLYFICFFVMMICLMLLGLDFMTAFSGVIATITSLGPGLGDVTYNYASVDTPAKVIFAFAMLLGRLELFAILVLFTPAFWRQ
jgi:trk system potassium uptake protein TrkH